MMNWPTLFLFFIQDSIRKQGGGKLKFVAHDNCIRILCVFLHVSVYKVLRCCTINWRDCFYGDGWFIIATPKGRNQKVKRLQSVFKKKMWMCIVLLPEFIYLNFGKELTSRQSIRNSNVARWCNERVESKTNMENLIILLLHLNYFFRVY